MNLPFTSLEQFRQRFNLGLHQLLNKNQLGTFILCLANASNNKELFRQLEQPLSVQFQQFLEKYQQELKSGENVGEMPEDWQVFMKLAKLGFDKIQLTQQRTESSWQCQYNQLRSFRPKRISAFQHNGEMSMPFIESQFHFNKPFMAKECFWSGNYNGMPLDIFYNKYPFADLHGLLVPQRENCLPQFLFENMHEYIWKLVQDLTSVLPGLAVAFNSYGAYASVNHLHFQMFVNSVKLPVSHFRWSHNDGEFEYPIKVYTAMNAEKSWRIIADLHAQKQPYNLLYMENKIYIIPRKVQGSIEVPAWSSGFTWSELCGSILMFDYDVYQGLSNDDIYQYLNAYSL